MKVHFVASNPPRIVRHISTAVSLISIPLLFLGGYCLIPALTADVCHALYTWEIFGWLNVSNNPVMSFYLAAGMVTSFYLAVSISIVCFAKRCLCKNHTNTDEGAMQSHSSFEQPPPAGTGNGINAGSD